MCETAEDIKYSKSWCDFFGLKQFFLYVLKIELYISLGCILLSFDFNSLKTIHLSLYAIGRGRGMDSVTSEGERILPLFFICLFFISS